MTTSFGIRKSGDAMSPRNPLLAEMDGLTLLKRDHDSLRILFSLFRDLEEDELEKKERLADEIIKELCIHTSVEEKLLYPLAERFLFNGSAFVKEHLDQHSKLERAMSDVMYIKPLDPYFDDKMRFIMDNAEAHFKEEEERLFARLHDNVKRDVLLTMSYKIQKARINAPTRPHPNMPKRGVLGKWATRLAATMDSVADSLTTRVTAQ